MRIQYAFADESFKYEYGIFDKNVGMDCLKQNRQSIELVSGRNDWAAFQFLLKSDEDFTLSVNGQPYFSPRGPLANVRLQAVVDGLPESAVSLFPVGLVEDDDRIKRSDILLENETVFVERYKVQCVWIEISVPAGTRPGTYTGEIRVFSHRMFERETPEKTFAFTLRVVNYTMDDIRESGFYLNLWLHMSNIARKHEVALWSDEHFEVLEHYVRSLAGLGQKSVMAVVSEVPWCGQNCFKVVNYLSDLFEYSMVGVRRLSSGVYEYDFSALERYISLCFRYGIDREIEIHGLLNVWAFAADGFGAPAADYPDAIRIRYYDETDRCFKYMENGGEIRDYIQALERFFVQNGWIDKVGVTADEPGDFALYKLRVRELQQTAPRMRIRTIVGHALFLNELSDFQGEEMDLVVHLGVASERWEDWQNTGGMIKGLRAFYVCCGPQRPNTFISSPLLDCRLIGWIAAYKNFDGFVRWNYTAWPENPRERMSYKFPVWQAGDTNFVYPSKNGRPLLTLRYKNLKRGIEDYSLLHKVREACADSDEILEHVKNLIFRCDDIAQYHPGKNRKSEDLYSLAHEDYVEAKRVLLESLARSG